MYCSEPCKILHFLTDDDSSDTLSEDYVNKDVNNVEDVLSLFGDAASNLGNSAVGAQGEVYLSMT